MEPREIFGEKGPLLVSPQAFYVAGDDHLRLTTFNSEASTVLALEGRFLTLAGIVVPFAERHVPASDRTATSTIHSLGEGFVLNAMVRATAGAPRRGECFALLEVIRGRTGAVQPLGVLVQGYVTDIARLGYPGSPIMESAVGPGALRAIAGSDPAAGAEISETVPVNARWRLLSVQASLVTDATAADREAALVIDDGATEVLRSPSGATHTASATARYAWSPHAQRGAVAQDATIPSPIPDLWLPEGFRVRTVTTNLQAGDDWGAPMLLVEELFEA